ncbi:DUF2958 domain-containing protein [Mesorhizobium sp. BR-1-1-8]|uniref:DUF2958 domain-containing protein n=1 Tax=Mesorhizobium sp. BR-1-1-8 TaxID=2876659 RepID=UPI001CC9EE2A|nr:DUF2958 domain-containing protein [Mesorhizobium sp. BR-1-1-8]MBZ9983996.1 DUF2958 domain-containing protein [Mesorhizobium sp. BR-1-1-8]
MIPATLLARLLANGRMTASGESIDPYPVVKGFAPEGYATWLLTEINPEEPDRALGLCDRGLGLAELGYVSLSELSAFRSRYGRPVEVDRHFVARKTLSEYAANSRLLGRIMT